MAIVVYKCDVCKREKEYQRNVEGLERVQRCTITHGCRGKMFQSKVLSDFVRASSPDRVSGLDEWRQRKVLHNHTQSIARSEWIIEHNLGTFPSISAFVDIPTEDDTDNREEIIPTDTVVVDDNNIILRFDRPWSGLAQLVARQSDPNLLRPFTRTISTTEIALQQISNGGEIAIATRVSSVGEGSPDLVQLNIAYTTTQNTTVSKTYDVKADVPPDSSSSSWKDYNKVVIKGKIYTIRSFSGIVDEMYNETIGSGSTFRFTAIRDASMGAQFRDILQDEVYILYANAPYTISDKATENYIDVYDITETKNPFSFVFDSGEFYVKENVIEMTYPPIRQIQV